MNNHHFRFEYIFLILIAVYSPVIFTMNPANPDANIILQNLRDFRSVYSYLEGLISFRTIDFQPVRDLSLAVDILIRKTGFNSIVFQNVLWWMGSLQLIRKILSRVIPELSTDRIILMTLLFGLYPLYSSAISWGMNRKHLLSFFFILLATDLWIQGSRRARWYSLCAYLVSVLSQPITILWPFFAFFWKSSKNKKVLAGLSVIMVALVAVNMAYYRTSEVYRFIYPPKEDPLNFPDMLLAIGHYSFQLVFPYLLSFRYTLGHWSVLWGLSMAVAFVFLGIRRINKVDHLPWLAFGLFPILIVLRDPQTLSDSYLICPSFALFIVAARFSERIRRSVLIAVIIVSGLLTSYESTKWRSRLELAESTFERRPDCGGAFNYIRASYESFTKAPVSPRTYVAENDCYKRMHVTPFMYRSMVLISANSHFYETDLAIDERLARLRLLASEHPFAHLNLIGLMLKSGDRNSAREEALNLIRWESVEVTPEYHPVAAKIVHPFCIVGSPGTELEFAL